MRNSRLILPIAALLFCAGTMNADVLKTYNFLGSLANPLNGNASVAGQFTIDLSNSRIPTFHFTSPMTIDSSTYFGSVFPFTATNPSANFIVAQFFSAGGSGSVDLLFETTLGSLSPDTFYTGPVSFFGITEISHLACGQVPLGDPTGNCPAGGVPTFSSTFTSGSATLVPEPGTVLLLFSSISAAALILKDNLRSILRLAK
jgi:hypothetical protein